MNAIWILALVLVPVGVGLLFRLLRRKNKPLVTASDISRLRDRVRALKERVKPGTPPASIVEYAGYFAGKSATALDFEQQVRARLHANLAALALKWVETVLDDMYFKADTRHYRTTSRLALGLELLKTMKFEPARDELQRVWVDEHAHVDAKMLAVMGSVWALASQGRHDEAAAEEALLSFLPMAGKVEDLSITCTVEREES